MSTNECFLASFKILKYRILQKILFYTTELEVLSSSARGTSSFASSPHVATIVTIATVVTIVTRLYPCYYLVVV